MERYSGSPFHYRDMHSMSPKLDLLDVPLDIGMQKFEPVSDCPCSAEESQLRINPMFLLSGMQQSERDKSNNLHSSNLFYPRRHFQQTIAPFLNSVPAEKFPAGTADVGHMEGLITRAVSSQKKFLVFDQSGGKTTLMCISGAHTPVRCRTFQEQRPPVAYNLLKDDPWINLHPLGMNDEHLLNNSRCDSENEMHEDTEELNALLCSDTDNDFTDEDEETSTGHSPSTMTNNGTVDFVKETVREADSFTGPTKRRKFPDESYDKASQMQAGSTLKIGAHSVFEDDADSACGNANNQTTGGRRSLSGNKRKERIQEALTVLQSIFPNADGEDAANVIESAIRYLKFLKVNAKALGLDTL